MLPSVAQREREVEENKIEMKQEIGRLKWQNDQIMREMEREEREREREREREGKRVDGANQPTHGSDETATLSRSVNCSEIQH